MKNNKQFVAKQNYTQNDIKNNPLDLLNNKRLLNKNAEFNDFYIIDDENNNALEKLSLSGFVDIGINILIDECASSGDFTKNTSSGFWTKNASSGGHTQNASSGHYNQNVSSGLGTKNASSGNSTQNASSGNYNKNASSGDYNQTAITGKNSICFDCGLNGLIKGVNGTWISLAEYEKNSEDKFIPCFALSAQIGNEIYRDFQGNILAENQFYCLVNHNFAKCEVVDNDIMVVISSKKVGEMQVLTTQYLKDMTNKSIKENCYVAKSGEYSAHGKTIKQAISDLQFKILQSEDVQEHIKRVKEQGFLTAQDYRLITGACKFGTNRFLEENGFDWDTKKTIEEVIELTKNQYGNNKLVELLKENKNG